MAERFDWHLARRYSTLIVTVAALPLLVIGALRVKSDTTNMQQWLPSGHHQRMRYEAFTGAFGPDDTLMVSWPGCALGDSRLKKLKTAYEGLADAADAEHKLIHRVVTGESLLASMKAKPFEMSRSAALARLTHTMIGADGETTCLLLQLNPLAKKDPHRLIDLVYTIARDACGLSSEQLRVGGGIYEAVVIERESTQAMTGFMGISVIIALAVAWVSLRSFRLAMIVMIAGGYSTLLCCALVHYLGGTMNAVMTILPSLIFVLVVSSAVHLVNYYRDAIRDGADGEAARQGWKVGWLPCTLAAVTTSIGMLSLTVSKIQPVRQFGFFSSLGIMASLAVVLTLVPTLLEVWPGNDTKRNPHRRYASLGRPLISAILRRPNLIMIVFGAISVFVGCGLFRTTSTVKIERMFREDNELIRNYRWIEASIGPLGALEVVVKFDDQCPLRMVQRLQVVQQIEARLRKLPDVDGTMSAGTLTPMIGSSSSLRAITQRSVVNKKLLAQRQQLVDHRLLAEAEGAEWWRITAFVPAMKDTSLDSVIDSVDDLTEDALQSLKHLHRTSDESSAQAGTQIDVECTGAFPCIQRAQGQLLSDLARSFVLAFVLICPVMMLVLRSVSAGIAAMLGNALPAVLIFGALGWLGVPIEIGTVLTGSIALGIAVDDTLHFLTWHQRSIRDGASRSQAIRTAFARCATAMTQTTLICGLGLLVFILSPFVPASRFAILMFALLIAALFADLVLLPAMLAGPAGRLFERQRRNERTDDSPPQDLQG